MPKVIPILNFIENIYRKNSTPDSKYYKLCQYYGVLSERTVKALYSLYFIPIVLIILSSAFELYFAEEYKPPLLVYIAGSFYSSSWYIAFLVAINWAIAMMASIASPLNDAFFFVLFANIPMIPKIIEGQLDELNEVLGRSKASLQEIKCRLLQYVWMHRTYNGYTKPI